MTKDFPIGGTIEEKERYAYVIGLPVHPLLGRLVDEEWRRHDELTHENDGLKKELEETKAELNEVANSLMKTKVEALHAAETMLREIKKVCT